MPFSATNPTSYPSGFNAGALGIPGLLIPIAGDPGAITNIINAIPGGVRGPASVIHTPQNYYWTGFLQGQENSITEGAFIMARVGGEGWRGNFGVRIVDTEENAYVNVPEVTGTYGPCRTTCRRTIFSSAYGPYLRRPRQAQLSTDFLPSLNFTFDLKPNLFLRMSAAETMSRPDYSALGGTVSLTDLTLTGSGGNPNLKPIKATVYDLAALEWYVRAPSVGAPSASSTTTCRSYVTFGTNPGTVLQDQFLSKAGAPNFQTYTISSPTNIGGELKGIELQVQQPIGKGFGFQANATYVDPRATTLQQRAPGRHLDSSPATWSAITRTGRVSARLAYTYPLSLLRRPGPQFAQENQANIRRPWTASVNFTITPNITLTGGRAQHHQLPS